MTEWRHYEPCRENEIVADVYRMDDLEARFFTRSLADDRHPYVGCVVCGQRDGKCRCTGDEMREWLARRTLAEQIEQVGRVFAVTRVVRSCERHRR